MSNTINKASTLEDVFFLFDPVHYLSTEAELEYFYVDRNGDIRNKIKLALKNDTKRNTPVHMLFTGHKGSGKSTEINKLGNELDGDFLIVKVLFNNRPDVDYIDVLLKAAMTLFRTATEGDIIKKYPAQIVDGLFADIYEFVHNKIFGNFVLSKDINLEITATAKINFLAVEFEAKFEREPLSREDFKNKIEKLLSELIDKINMLSDVIREKCGTPVLFIFEDADRIDLKSAKEIFYEHSNTLINIRASSIYVIDIALRYNINFKTTQASISEFYCLPNIKLTNRNGEAIAENREIMEKIIFSRAQSTLFNEDAIALLIKFSGGLIRSLIILTQRATSRAIIKQDSDTVTIAHVEYACAEQRGDFIAMLKREHYPMLSMLHNTKELTSDDNTQNLLQSTALLEYENGELWCDVHPIILPEVLKRVPQVL